VHPFVLAVCAAAFGALLGPGEAAATVRFTDVTVEAGVTYLQRAEPVTTQTVPEAAEQASGGAAAGDVDGDGWVDLVVTRGDAPPILFHNRGDGTFSDRTAEAGDLADAITQGSNGVAFGDIDNDGDLDLYVTSMNTTRFHLFVNQGDGSFVEQAVARGAAIDTGVVHYGTGVAFGDYDRDGYLDVFAAEWRAHPLPPLPRLPGASHNRLLHNRGAAQPGYFDDVTEAAGIQVEVIAGVPTSPALGTPGYSPGFVDFDGDGWPELAWVADWGHSRLFWNDGDGTFHDGTVAAGVGLERSGMGSTQDDFDGDGRIDWLTTSIFGRESEIPFGVSNQLYLNRGDRTFTNATVAAGVADGGFGWGASGFDFDNDGDVDLVNTNGFIAPGHPEEARWMSDRTRLYENMGGARFVDVAESVGIVDTDQGKGALTFDYDRDGDLDVFIANHAGMPILYRNDGGNVAAWLQIELRGTRSNRGGIGAVVTIEPDAADPSTFQTQQLLANSNFVSQDEPLLHFGLGAREAPVDKVVVRWPSGNEQTIEKVSARTRLLVVEPGQRVQSEAQSACVVAMNDAAVTAARSVADQVRFCLRAAARGRLPAGQDGDACTRADRDGARAAVRRAVADVEVAACAERPDFGVTDSVALDVAASAELRGLAEDVFGEDLDLAAAADVTRKASRCQRSMYRVAMRLTVVGQRRFRRCKKAGLTRGTIASAADLSACFDHVAADGGGKLARAKSKLASLLVGRCGGLVDAEHFPGTCREATDFGVCVIERAACRTCRLLDRIDDLDRDCDLFDDGVADATCATPTPADAWLFEDVTTAAGIDYVHAYDDQAYAGPTFDRAIIAGGVAAGDYDGDGWIDLYAVGGPDATNHLLRNLGDGTFEDVADAAGVALAGTFGSGPTFADYDGDGHLDLLVGGVNGTSTRLLRNLGDGTFADVTAQMGLDLDYDTLSAAFGDYDRDGDLDLYLAHWQHSIVGSERLWRNDGDAGFHDVTVAAGVGDARGLFGLDWSFTPNFADLDSDGWPDLAIAGDFGGSLVFLNDGDGTFRNATTEVIDDENGMGAALGDYDGDGDLDWFVSSIWDPNGQIEGNWGASGNRLYRNLGDGTFEDATDEAGLRRGYWGWGSCMADFDLDGTLDVFHVNGFRTNSAVEYFTDPARLFIARGDGTFAERSADLGLEERGQGRGVACFDYDGDGDVDLFVANNHEAPHLWRNRAEVLGHHFLSVRLRSTLAGSEGTNTAGIGARVLVTAGGATQMRELRAGSNFTSQDPPVAHFGLGTATVVDELRVIWPDGAETVTNDEPVDRFVVLSHP